MWTVDGEITRSQAISRFVRPAAQLQDVKFSLGQAGGRPRQRGSRHVGSGEHGSDGGPVKRQPGQDPGRFGPADAGRCGRASPSAWKTSAAASRQAASVQLGTAYPGRVAGAVGALVMAAGDLSQRGEHRRTGQDPAALMGCSLTSSQSSGRSAPAAPRSRSARRPGRCRARARRGRRALPRPGPAGPPPPWPAARHLPSGR